MPLLDTTSVRAYFATIYVAFGEDDFTEPEEDVAVAASAAGLTLRSSHADHYPRFVIDDTDSLALSSPWVGLAPIFDQELLIPGPSLRVHDTDFGNVAEVEWPREQIRRVRVYRTGSVALDALSTADVTSATGIEKWLITFTDTRP